ncbi:hypothetical protein BX666DRAFT_2003973 [Dichotomocladium elegans]|nr:hypothetical protein BX666DRAFT_2003973 [Dichotomocladium elegans]
MIGIDKSELEEYQYAFFGYQAFEWISEYTTAATREEAELVASEFVLYGWISQVLDKSDRENSSKDESVTFKMGRNTMYHVTARGRQVLGWDKPYASDECLADTHEQVIQRQRVLASRLRHSSSNLTKSLTRTSGKAVAGEHAGGTGKHSGIASSISSGSSAEEPISDVEVNSDLVGENSALHGLSGVEFVSPIVQTGEVQEPDNDPQKNIDEVTERLLQLRSPSNAFHPHQRQDTTDSAATNTTTSSRPSSLCTQDSINVAALDPNSSWSKLRQILLDPLMRMYFRDFLKSQFCEENVNIWVDYYNLRKKVQRYNRHDAGTSGTGPVSTRELLQDSYAIYDTYLGPTATAEVNIDHQLRQEIIAYVSATFTVYNNNIPTASSKAAAAGGSIPFVSTAFQPTHQQQVTLLVNGHTGQCLKSLLRLYDRVDDHICRIMAQDSVPKFVKTEKYRELVAHSASPNTLLSRSSTEQNLDVL